MAAQNVLKNGIPAVSGDVAPVFPDISCGLWHVLHTKSRQEKAVAADLAALRIGHFLPLVRQVRYYGDRKAIVEMPMFPGYVFLRGSMDDAYQADRTKRIASIIRVVSQERLDWELRNLHFALSGGATLDPYPYLKEGIRVEVRSGPFRGLQGIVKSRNNPERIALQVDMLGQAVAMEINGALLDPID